MAHVPSLIRGQPPREGVSRAWMTLDIGSAQRHGKMSRIWDSLGSSIRGTLLPQPSRPMLSGVEVSGAHTILGGSENRFVPRGSLKCPSPSEVGRAGIARARRRGHPASWPSLAAVAVCGGVQECSLAVRVGCEAWEDSIPWRNYSVYARKSRLPGGTIERVAPSAVRRWRPLCSRAMCR